MTSAIRVDHTHWACPLPLQGLPGVKCDQGNEISAEYCKNCKKKRAVKAKALNRNGDKIGKLIEITVTGEELWDYD